MLDGMVQAGSPASGAGVVVPLDEKSHASTSALPPPSLQTSGQLAVIVVASVAPDAVCREHWQVPAGHAQLTSKLDPSSHVPTVLTEHPLPLLLPPPPLGVHVRGVPLPEPPEPPFPVSAPPLLPLAAPVVRPPHAGAVATMLTAAPKTHASLVRKGDALTPQA